MWALYWSMGQSRCRKKRKTPLYILLIETFRKEQMEIQILMAFVASPEMVAAIAISGRLDFNPITDT